MRLLAIETSGRHGSVAVLDAERDEARLLHEKSLSTDERAAQSLVPTIQKVLQEVDWEAGSLDLVAVAAGPGSFTGLRIGVVAAKTFAYAAKAELIGVNTLFALAMQTVPASSSLWTLLDAQRQELFAARFEQKGEGLPQETYKTCILSQANWLEGLSPGDRVTGPGLARLLPKLPKEVEAMPEASWQPMARGVGQVGWQNYCDGLRNDCWKLVPDYYRLSAAEEQRS